MQPLASHRVAVLPARAGNAVPNTENPTKMSAPTPAGLITTEFPISRAPFSPREKIRPGMIAESGEEINAWVIYWFPATNPPGKRLFLAGLAVAARVCLHTLTSHGLSLHMPYDASAAGAAFFARFAFRFAGFFAALRAVLRAAPRAPALRTVRLALAFAFVFVLRFAFFAVTGM
jgi:hypothetical protein